MKNKEQIQRDIVIALDFVEQIVDNPDLLDKIPNGVAITFLDEENTKVEKGINKLPVKKYVRIKRHFEVL